MNNPRVTQALDAAAESTFLASSDRRIVIHSIEKCAELQIELVKWLGGSIENLPALVEKIGDATICLAQLRYGFGFVDVDRSILTKLDKIMGKIRVKEGTA